VSFTGRYVPKQLDRGLSPVISFALNMMLAGIATIVVVMIGATAMLFNTAPEWLSLIVEPLSLILLPGLCVGLAGTGPHDLEPHLVVDASVLFYFLLFLFLFQLRTWRRRRRRRKTN
jgi:hypothetical protein